VDIKNDQFSVVFDFSKPYLQATYTSNIASAEIIKQILKTVAQKCRSGNFQKLMLISKNMNKLDYIQTFQVIAECAPLFMNVKCAFLEFFPVQLERLDFAKMVAENRGITFMYFTEFEAAEKWLMQD
jgi:hypothetical protein